MTVAALAVGIVPYTILLMLGTNKVLLEGADQAETAEEKVEAKAASMKQLLDQWATLNLGRSLMLASAAVTATWTALGRGI